jgi:hypothetical protein
MSALLIALWSVFCIAVGLLMGSHTSCRDKAAPFSVGMLLVVVVVLTIAILSS